MFKPTDKAYIKTREFLFSLELLSPRAVNTVAVELVIHDKAKFLNFNAEDWLNLTFIDKQTFTRLMNAQALVRGDSFAALSSAERKAAYVAYGERHGFVFSARLLRLLARTLWLTPRDLLHSDETTFSNAEGFGAGALSEIRRFRTVVNYPT